MRQLRVAAVKGHTTQGPQHDLVSADGMHLDPRCDYVSTAGLGAGQRDFVSTGPDGQRDFVSAGPGQRDFVSADPGLHGPPPVPPAAGSPPEGGRKAPKGRKTTVNGVQDPWFVQGSQRVGSLGRPQASSHMQFRVKLSLKRQNPKNKPVQLDADLLVDSGASHPFVHPTVCTKLDAVVHKLNLSAVRCPLPLFNCC
jgi:hypothetical protein